MTRTIKHRSRMVFGILVFSMVLAGCTCEECLLKFDAICDSLCYPRHTEACEPCVRFGISYCLPFCLIPPPESDYYDFQTEPDQFCTDNPDECAEPVDNGQESSGSEEQ
jgi:hypothetical protein